MNDDGHVERPVRPAREHPTEDGGARVVEEPFDATEALLRLLIGGLGLGADELRERLRRWEAEAAKPAPAGGASIAPPSATISEALRRTAIGMLFEGQKRARRGFSRMVVGFARASLGMEYVFTTALEPAIRRTPLNGVLGRLDELSFMALLTLDQWTDRGWVEEQRGRRMAREAAARLTDEILDYVARDPRIRELIQQQSASMAGETLDEARDRMAGADARVEQLAHRLLRRPTRELTPRNVTPHEASPIGQMGS